MTGTTADLGTLEQAGALWRLRFARPLAYPPELVWQAITEPEQLQHWFPQRITGPWVPGAVLTFAHPGGLGPDFSGEVRACEPVAAARVQLGHRHHPAGDRARRGRLRADPA